MMMPKFIITPDIYEKCTSFAKASVGSSSDKYARRNQFNIEKIVKDIRNGKIGEEGTYKVLLGKFPQLSSPDHNIYDKKDKSWDPDLKDLASGIRVGVKSQDYESAIHFGESWVFQFRAGQKYDVDTGIFGGKDDKHYVAFVALNVPKKTGEVRAIVSVSWLHDKKLFKEMKKQNLRGNKVAVYYEDLANYKEELFQL
jgi:hypothetical protein